MIFTTNIQITKLNIQLKVVLFVPQFVSGCFPVTGFYLSVSCLVSVSLSLFKISFPEYDSASLSLSGSAPLSLPLRPCLAQSLSQYVFQSHYQSLSISLSVCLYLSVSVFLCSVSLSSCLLGFNICLAQSFHISICLSLVIDCIMRKTTTPAYRLAQMSAERRPK